MADVARQERRKADQPKRKNLNGPAAMREAQALSVRKPQNKKALAANAEVLLGLHQRLVGDAGFEPATPAV
jgi:hypothetical protein